MIYYQQQPNIICLGAFDAFNYLQFKVSCNVAGENKIQVKTILTWFDSHFPLSSKINQDQETKEFQFNLNFIFTCNINSQYVILFMLELVLYIIAISLVYNNTSNQQMLINFQQNFKKSFFSTNPYKPKRTRSCL